MTEDSAARCGPLFARFPNLDRLRNSLPASKESFSGNLLSLNIILLSQEKGAQQHLLELTDKLDVVDCGQPHGTKNLLGVVFRTESSRTVTRT